MDSDTDDDELQRALAASRAACAPPWPTAPPSPTLAQYDARDPSVFLMLTSDPPLCPVCVAPMPRLCDPPPPRGADDAARLHRHACGHAFHVACARAALGKSNRCPCCPDARPRPLTPTGARDRRNDALWVVAGARDVRGACGKCGDPVFRAQPRDRWSADRGYVHNRCPPRGDMS